MVPLNTEAQPNVIIADVIIFNLKAMKKLFKFYLLCSLFSGCGGNDQPSVKSPFSHLDTTKVQNKNNNKKESNDDGTHVKSPFSNLDK